MTNKNSWVIQATEEPSPLTPHLLDFEDYTDEDLELLFDSIAVEIKARRVMKETPLAMESAARNYQLAVSRNVPPGETMAWTQPQGAHDAYPKGWRVKHNDKIWFSTIPANVWEPGITGWTEDREDGGFPTWIQPLGAHDAYKLGDIVEYDGRLWISDADGNAWKPGEYGWIEYFLEPDGGYVFNPEQAPLWVRTAHGYPEGAYVMHGAFTWVSDVDDNQGEPGIEGWTQHVDPVEYMHAYTPEEAAPWESLEDGYPVDSYALHADKTWRSTIDNNLDEPGISEFWEEHVVEVVLPEWVRPTGGHDAYNIGDQVTFQGAAYESVIASNTWSPVEYPAGWKAL